MLELDRFAPEREPLTEPDLEVFDPPLLFEDELHELRFAEPPLDLLLEERDELRPELELLLPPERPDELFEDDELDLLFDPDEPLLREDVDRPLPLDRDDDERFADALRDEDFALPPDERSLLLMLLASAD